MASLQRGGRPCTLGSQHTCVLQPIWSEETGDCSLEPGRDPATETGAPQEQAGQTVPLGGPRQGLRATLKRGPTPLTGKALCWGHTGPTCSG